MTLATALTYATAPWRLLVIIAFGLGVLAFECRRLLLWLAIGAVLHSAAVSMLWLAQRDIDVSLLMPWTYSPVVWSLTIVYYCLWVWLWINE